ncbi:uncharacterized protein [Palaemon carinicauda]|uniref:uncharacterized protein isoform X2 n=1 Tax=Palaemon carinicauda TaxID=392227 RepID=UPI0035B6830A
MRSSEQLVSILLTFAAYAAASDEGDPPKGSHAGEPGLIHFPLASSHGARDVRPSFGFRGRRGYNITRPDGRSLFSDLAEEFPYSYEYNVKDDYEGAHFGHKESGEGSNTNGQYFVRLPDGRVQTVTYYTDKEGFHSDVVYAGDVTPPSGGRYKAPPAVYREREEARPKASPASSAPSTYKSPDEVRPEAPPAIPATPYQGPGLRIPYLPDTTFSKGPRGPAPGKGLVTVPATGPSYVPSIPGLALYASVRPYVRSPPVNYLLGTSGYQSSEVESFDPDSIYTEPSSSEERGDSSEEATRPRGSSAGYAGATSSNRGTAERLTTSGLTLEIINPHTNKTILINLDDLDKPVDPTKLKHKSEAHHDDEGDVPVPGFDISGTLYRNAVDGEDFKGKPKRGSHSQI